MGNSFVAVINVNKRKKPISFKKIAFVLWFVLIPTVHFAVFYLFVNLNSFKMAFQLTKSGETSWSFANFTRFFDEMSTAGSSLHIAFRNTGLTFLVTQIMFVVSFFVSYFLYKRIFLFRFFRSVFFLPSIIAGTIITSIFMRIAGTNGPIAALVQKLWGLEYRPSLLGDERFANGTVFLHYIWLLFPGNMILLGGTFSRLPPSVLEQAKLDGASWLQEAFRIIIPMIWPTISLMLMLNIAGIFGASGSVFLLTQGGYNTQTLSNWMYMQVYTNVGDVGESNVFNYMSAVGLMLTVVSIVLALSLRKLANVYFSEVQY